MPLIERPQRCCDTAMGEAKDGEVLADRWAEVHGVFVDDQLRAGVPGHAVGWILGALTAGALGLGAALLWMRRQFVVVTVEGASMAPTLADGDRVVVQRRRLDQVRNGDVVVLEPPVNPPGGYDPGPAGPDGRRWNIKRAVALPGDPLPAGVTVSGVDRVPAGSLVVFGDNPDSIDSRQRGLFDAAQLLGVAIRRLGGQPL
ncbi:S26 family signal peptidase [Micromonospora sp. CPCC 205539]|uniref:S26 family signal peptidase n=1 Tax=Micromonospora sp. CPCC 205539 TaxID=3122408 RepID=UPI002FEFF8F8